MTQSLEQNKMDVSEELISDDFQCCVCLDVLYKPVVLSCGHVSCFWCLYKAMDFHGASHCPVCRNSYNHFPRICWLLHFLLLRLYPSACKEKERHVAEEEKLRGNESPRFEDYLLDSSLVQDQERNSPCEHNEITAITKSTSHTATNDVNSVIIHSDTNGTHRQILVKDLQCGVCKQLLYRPVVLNCGHVSCEACMSNAQQSVCKCPTCQCEHPMRLPVVCLVLEHFLEEQFPEAYSARKKSSPILQSGCPSANLIEKDEHGAQRSGHENIYAFLTTGDRPEVHVGVGCDYCGMSPIIGERYKCKDCVEKMGFDLCDRCYNSSSKLPGRFNQQHTEEHQFVVVEPRFGIFRIRRS